MMNLIDQLKRHVAFNACVFKANDNKRLIGFGHEINKKPLQDELQRNFNYQPMTDDEATQLLACDILDLYDIAMQYVDFTGLDHVRQSALLALIYVIGIHSFARNRALINALNRDYFELCSLLVGSMGRDPLFSELAFQFKYGEYK